MRKSIKTLFLIIPICFVLGIIVLAGRVYPIEIGSLGGNAGGTSYDTVSQTDAEGGTSTTSYVWSPQRVFQAIVARLASAIGVTMQNVAIIGTNSTGTFRNLTVTETLETGSQWSTGGSWTTTVGVGQSAKVISKGSSTNSISFDCDGIISFDGSGSVRLGASATVGIAGTTTTYYPTIDLVSQYVGVSVYGTSPTTLFTTAIPPLNKDDALEIKYIFSFTGTQQKNTKVTLGGVSLSYVNLGTSTVYINYNDLVVNKGSTTSQFVRYGGVSYTEAISYTGGTNSVSINTGVITTLIIEANTLNNPGTCTLEYVNVQLHRKSP